MDEPKKKLEENRYYKHICTKNQICQRNTDQAIYIDLIKQEVNYDFDNLLNYDHKKLRTDQNYKDDIIKKRTNKYNLEMKKQRKKELERIYLPAFEAYTIKKEDTGIYRAKTDIKFSWDMRPKPGDFMYNENQKVTARGLWLTSNYHVHYSASKRLIMKYIQQLTGEDISFSYGIGMSPNEYKEFQDFIIERSSEYSTLI